MTTQDPRPKSRQVLLDSGIHVLVGPLSGLRVPESFIAAFVVAVNIAAWAATARWVGIVQDSQLRIGAFPDPPSWWRALSLSTESYWSFNLAMGAACVGAAVPALYGAMRFKCWLLGAVLASLTVVSGLVLIVLSVVGTF